MVKFAVQISTRGTILSGHTHKVGGADRRMPENTGKGPHVRLTNPARGAII